MPRSAMPSFFRAATTDPMRLLLAARAAAAVAPPVVTPAWISAVSGCARTSPWPVMAKVRTSLVRGSAAQAGRANITIRARPQTGPKARLFFMAGLPVGYLSTRHAGEKLRRNQGAEFFHGRAGGLS